MSEDIQIDLEDVQKNKRFHTRHRTNSRVFITPPNGKRVECRAENLCANGVAIRTNNLGLTPGMVCGIAFVINLGQVLKIHKRNARVVHVTKGLTGFMMDKFEGK